MAGAWLRSSNSSRKSKRKKAKNTKKKGAKSKSKASDENFFVCSRGAAASANRVELQVDENNNESVKAEEETPPLDRRSDEPGVLHELIKQANNLSLEEAEKMIYGECFENEKEVLLPWCNNTSISEGKLRVLDALMRRRLKMKGDESKSRRAVIVRELKSVISSLWRPPALPLCGSLFYFIREAYELADRQKVAIEKFEMLVLDAICRFYGEKIGVVVRARVAEKGTREVWRLIGGTSRMTVFAQGLMQFDSIYSEKCTVLPHWLLIELSMMTAFHLNSIEAKLYQLLKARSGRKTSIHKILALTKAEDEKRRDKILDAIRQNKKVFKLKKGVVSLRATTVCVLLSPLLVCRKATSQTLSKSSSSSEFDSDDSFYYEFPDIAL
ncbi:hypothetical protein WR25_17791 [Diploscapter pachys]|uniref:Uncharacterized protein n=1 Tax=Diploscapter pachys TaxID=2018661 RepID=A0A2A2LEU8_9BILA|nr:hypothetical protein WR25_17791 [Diploscapter pachys]